MLRKAKISCFRKEVSVSDLSNSYLPRTQIRVFPEIIESQRLQTIELTIISAGFTIQSHARIFRWGIALLASHFLMICFSHSHDAALMTLFKVTRSKILILKFTTRTIWWQENKASVTKFTTKQLAMKPLRKLISLNLQRHSTSSTIKMTVVFLGAKDPFVDSDKQRKLNGFRINVKIDNL